MKAYVIEQAGGPEALQLRDIAAVEPGADEVQIRVRAFGLNRAEMYRRAGKMGPIAGQVVLGIAAVGEVIHDPAGVFRTGQRVATPVGGMLFSLLGSYAEGIRAGQTLLVRGATSSVGLAAVTYAKARGLKVIATTRSAANSARLQSMGASDVVHVCAPNARGMKS